MLEGEWLEVLRINLAYLLSSAIIFDKYLYVKYNNTYLTMGYHYGKTKQSILSNFPEAILYRHSL